MTKKEIDKYESILLLLSSERCSVCTALDKRLRPWVQSNYPDLEYRKIILENFPILTGELMVFSVPAILLFQNGKEILRKAGVFSLLQTFDELDHLINH